MLIVKLNTAGLVIGLYCEREVSPLKSFHFLLDVGSRIPYCPVPSVSAPRALNTYLYLCDQRYSITLIHALTRHQRVRSRDGVRETQAFCDPQNSKDVLYVGSVNDIFSKKSKSGSRSSLGTANGADDQSPLSAEIPIFHIVLVNVTAIGSFLS